MANIRLAHIVLTDKWPGEANQNLGIPTDGWDNTTENFNTSDDTAKAMDPPIPIGQKRSVYTDNTNCPGMYTMMYLAYHDPSAVDVSGDFSDGNAWCSQLGDSSHTQWSDTSNTPYFVVSRCYTGTNTNMATDATRGAPIALPCATITADSSVTSSSGSDAATDGYGGAYGWFWVGGVCPVKDVTVMADLTYGSTCGGRGVDLTAGDDQRRGDLYCEFSGATLMLQSGEFTELFDATLTSAYSMLTPVGYACVSAG